MRAVFWTLSAAVFATIALAGAGPASPVRADAAISELLSYSVPAEDWQEHLKKRKLAGWVPPPLPSLVPDDHAEIGKLVDWWQTDASQSADLGEPSPAVRERLLAYCEENPGKFGTLAQRFSASQEGVVPRLQKLHDRLAANAADDETREALLKLRFWLMTEAGLFRDELLAAAERHFIPPEDAGSKTAFAALQKFAPGAAKAMLLRQAEDESSVFARCSALLHLHTMEDAPAGPWREGLQKIVADRSAPAPLRAKALRALHHLDWPEKAEWVLTLFDDAALGTVKMTEYDKEEPLALLVKSAPDAWVPRIMPLVGSPNRVVHDNAVRCLFQLGRADALRPLLPWLSDPSWALKEERDGRRDVLYALEKVDLPESVPGLLWALEHDSEYLLAAAASALARQKATLAVPALRKAIEREPMLFQRKSLVKSLLDLEGVPLEEQARAVELYKSLTLTRKNRQAVESEALALPFGEVKSIIEPGQRLLATTGLVVSDESAFHTPALAEALARQAENLREKGRREIADALEADVSLWHTPASERLLAARLRAGRVTAEWLWQLVSTDELPAADLKALQDLPPNAAAVVALLVHDESRIQQILNGGTAEAQAMLLACARVKRAPLPLDKVAALLDSKHILCARGAERYLEAEDSPQARAMLQRRFKGEARILGARMSFDPGHYAYGSLGNIQEQLRKQVLAAKEPLEIHALLSAGYWGDVGQLWVEIQGEKATLVNQQGGCRYRTRELAAAELAELRAYVSQQRVDELPPLTLPVDDGIQYEYVHLTADGGRRVFMNNPGTYSGGLQGRAPMFAPGQDTADQMNDSVYVCLVSLFQKLVEDRSQLKVAYRTASPVPGLRLVIPVEQMQIDAVMAEDGVLKVHGATPADKQPHWIAINLDGSLVRERKVSGPALQQAEGDREFFSPADGLPDTAWRSTAMGGQLRSTQRRADALDGLWLFQEKREPRLAAKGDFGMPVTSPDGQWAVASRLLGASWAEPNDMVRINLATGDVVPIKLEAADNCGPVTRLVDSGRILVMRCRDEDAPGITPEAGPEKPEYHLLDPASGALERVTGEFGPLEDETWRSLQRTEEPGVVWAAMPRSDKDGARSTRIGRYDLRRFAFTQIMEVPSLHFTSMDLWVDEAGRQVFLAVNGDLLAFPLPAQAPDKGKAPPKP